MAEYAKPDEEKSMTDADDDFTSFLRFVPKLYNAVAGGAYSASLTKRVTMYLVAGDEVFVEVYSAVTRPEAGNTFYVPPCLQYR